MISKPNLDTKKPVGNGVDAPVYASNTTIIPIQTADMSGGDSIPTGASTENLSAKWKGGKQDIPTAGRNQYQ